MVDPTPPNDPLSPKPIAQTRRDGVYEGGAPGNPDEVESADYNGVPQGSGRPKQVSDQIPLAPRPAPPTPSAPLVTPAQLAAQSGRPIEDLIAIINSGVAKIPEGARRENVEGSLLSYSLRHEAVQKAFNQKENLNKAQVAQASQKAIIQYDQAVITAARTFQETTKLLIYNLKEQEKQSPDAGRAAALEELESAAKELEAVIANQERALKSQEAAQEKLLKPGDLVQAGMSSVAASPSSAAVEVVGLAALAQTVKENPYENTGEDRIYHAQFVERQAELAAMSSILTEEAPQGSTIDYGLRGRVSDRAKVLESLLNKKTEETPAEVKNIFTNSADTSLNALLEELEKSSPDARKIAVLRMDLAAQDLSNKPILSNLGRDLDELTALLSEKDRLNKPLPAGLSLEPDLQKTLEAGKTARLRDLEPKIADLQKRLALDIAYVVRPPRSPNVSLSAAAQEARLVIPKGIVAQRKAELEAAALVAARVKEAQDVIPPGIVAQRQEELEPRKNEVRESELSPMDDKNSQQYTESDVEAMLLKDMEKTADVAPKILPVEETVERENFLQQAPQSTSDSSVGDEARTMTTIPPKVGNNDFVRRMLETVYQKEKDSPEVKKVDDKVWSITDRGNEIKVDGQKNVVSFSKELDLEGAVRIATVLKAAGRGVDFNSPNMAPEMKKLMTQAAHVVDLPNKPSLQEGGLSAEEIKVFEKTHQPAAAAVVTPVFVKLRELKASYQTVRDISPEERIAAQAAEKINRENYRQTSQKFSSGSGGGSSVDMAAEKKKEEEAAAAAAAKQKPPENRSSSMGMGAGG